MVSSSGDRLLEPAAERLYVEALLPYATVLTPNLREAQVLLGTPIRTLADQHEAARALGALGPSVVVVKGGHAVEDTGDDAVDVVFDGTSTRELRARRIDTRTTTAPGAASPQRRRPARPGDSASRRRSRRRRRTCSGRSPAAPAGSSAAATARSTTSAGPPSEFAGRSTQLSAGCGVLSFTHNVRTVVWILVRHCLLLGLFVGRGPTGDASPAPDRPAAAGRDRPGVGREHRQEQTTASANPRTRIGLFVVPSRRF
jgi:hypothetical protein